MKIAVTITVRMKSKRLPRKAMRNLAGKPMIEHLIERLKAAKLPEAIILCTSTNPEDDILIDVARKDNIQCFRGDEVDVLKRLLDAAKEYNINFIVSTTGDNPLTDPDYIDKIIKKFSETNADYITCLDLPLGTFSYGVKVDALEKVMELKKETDTEIWGGYFAKSPLFKKEVVDVEKELRHPEIRLTVDTQEDFELMEEIHKRFYEPGKVFGLRDVIMFLMENPQLMEINKRIIQRGVPDIAKMDFSNMETYKWRK